MATNRCDVRAMGFLTLTVTSAAESMLPADRSSAAWQLDSLQIAWGAEERNLLLVQRAPSSLYGTMTTDLGPAELRP